ncbi:MAG: precorrin-3B C(17)-methyltransferase [Rhodobiaceae bacterium]|nr:precorrin-3B C(17)-methyltransferase [Rhodobiaceae bacterium]
MPRPDPVIVVLTASGAETALRCADRLGAVVHGRGARVDATVDDVMAHLRALHAAGHPIVGVCAAAILIRALAPVLSDKRRDPPVIAVAEDGSGVVPLLGGHHGANRMAMDLAAHLGGHAAVTTAGELALGVALDQPPDGWRLENPEDAKAAMAGLLNGAPARISGNADWLAPLIERSGVESFINDDPHAPVVLSVEGALPLVYRRQTLALGVGCSRGCPPDELIGLVRKTLADNGRSAFEVAGVWSLDLKANEAAVHALAADLGVPARFFPADVLEVQTPRLANPSDTVFAEVGCHGVAESAALAAAGPAALLAIEKTKTGQATCAAADFSGEGAPGRPRGRLAVVGMGPGAADWRTPEASRLIAEADDVVGYGLYIDLLGGAAAGKPRHDFPLGGEEDRCRFALERAGEGANVALICSGDAGIYAMGALVMELMDRAPDAGGVSDAARRVEIVNAPGISALQAASARAGALLGHDFCTISLSDLLTPRDDILKRIEAAAMGDFVIAFYNPVSKRRRDLLARARDILLAHRPAETPVLLAANLGREAETLRRRTLATLEVDEVDMLTVVLVGSSTSRAFQSGDTAAGAEGWYLYTPRGYAKKLDGEAGQ